MNRLLLLVALFVPTGCVSRQLLTDYDSPPSRLRSQVSIEPVRGIDPNADSNLRLPIDIWAPRDSDVVMVLSSTATLADLRRALDTAFTNLGNRTRLSPLSDSLLHAVAGLTITADRRRVNMLESYEPVTSFYQASTGTFGGLAWTLRKRPERPQFSSEGGIVRVKAGMRQRFIVDAVLDPRSRLQPREMQVTLRWITVATSAAEFTKIGRVNPVVVDSLRASTRYSRINFFAATLAGLGFLAAVFAISSSG